MSKSLLKTPLFSSIIAGLGMMGFSAASYFVFGEITTYIEDVIVYLLCLILYRDFENEKS